MRGHWLGILGIHHTSTAEPGVPLARIFKQHNRKIYITGLCTYQAVPALSLSNHFDNIELLPDLANGKNAFLDAIDIILERHNLDFLIPGLDAEVFMTSLVREELRSKGIETLLPSYEDVCRVSKTSLVLDNTEDSPVASFAMGKVIQNPSDLDDLIYPVVIKGNICDSYTVYSIGEAKVIFDRISQIWGVPAVAQEYLAGEEYAVCAIAGPEAGSLAGASAIKKIGITQKGNTWMAVTIANEELTEIASSVVRYFNWLGPMEIELRYVEGRGFVIFEINPRFPSWLEWLDCDTYGIGHLFLDLLLNREHCRLDVPSGRVGVRINRYASFPIERLLQLSSSGYYEHHKN